MFGAIRDVSKSDGELLKLLGDASECARFYLFSKRRQKSCDGMGELDMIKEEFEQALNMLTTYCKEKGYVLADIQYEIDSSAKDLAK
ncbi:MAG: hypothetical protein M0Z61_10525 [Nitrospiraceae bacterium]|nr:hypothetical protein [Nitrospiraceae bacterium]